MHAANLLTARLGNILKLSSKDYVREGLVKLRELRPGYNILQLTRAIKDAYYTGRLGAHL